MLEIKKRSEWFHAASEWLKVVVDKKHVGDIIITPEGRKDYFLTVEDKRRGGKEHFSDTFPTKAAAVKMGIKVAKDVYGKTTTGKLSVDEPLPKSLSGRRRVSGESEKDFKKRIRVR